MPTPLKFTYELDLSQQRITNMAQGTSGSDAVTVDQLYDQTNDTPFKPAARLATTGNIDTSNPGSTFDGITAVAGDIVLVWKQDNKTQNWLYNFVSPTSPMTRVDWANQSWEVQTCMAFFVSEGNQYHDTMFLLTTNSPYTFGTTQFDFIIYPPTKIYRAVITATASYLVTHNLGTYDVDIILFPNASPRSHYVPAFERTSVNSVTLFFAPDLIGTDFVVIAEKKI